MFGAELGLGEIAAIVVIVVVVVLPFVGVYGWAMRLFGRHPLHPSRRPVDPLTLDVAERLRAMQSQLDDVSARMDFAERMVIEQRDQLRDFGAPPARTLQRENTPV